MNSLRPARTSSRSLQRLQRAALVIGGIAVLAGGLVAGASPASALGCQIGPGLAAPAAARGIACTDVGTPGGGSLGASPVTSGCNFSPDTGTLPLGFLDFLNSAHAEYPEYEDHRGGVFVATTPYTVKGRYVGHVRFTQRPGKGFEIAISNDTVRGFTQAAYFSCYSSSAGFTYSIEEHAAVPRTAPPVPLAPGSPVPASLEGRVVTNATSTPLGVSGRSLVRFDLTNLGSEAVSAQLIVDESDFPIDDFPTLTSGATCQVAGTARVCSVPMIEPGATRTVVALVSRSAGSTADDLQITVLNDGMAKFTWDLRNAPVNRATGVHNHYLVPMD